MSSLVIASVALVTILQAQAAPAAADDARGRARAILASVAAKDFARIEAQFDDKMKAALPPGRLAVLWSTLEAQAGAFKGCSGEPRLRTIADKRMVITPCEFEHAKIDAQTAFDAEGRISGFAFRPSEVAVNYTPPAYVDASAYAESDLTVVSGEWTLPATLTLPNGAGPFPAVVLVHGSGPQDRDSTIGRNKPFKDLALGLASRGVAVLRYEKRTKIYGGGSGTPGAFTVKQEVIDDALAAAALLRTQPKIDPARVFVLGHSLGGTVIPRIGAADAKLAGLVVMAGATRPLPEIILAQARYLAGTDGTVTPEEQKGIDEASALVESVRALKPEDAAGGRVIFNAPASYWLDLRGYDPASAARGLALPMLILQGERDYQVTMEDLARWKAALGSRRDVTFQSYPALNHLFIAGTGPATPAEYDVPGHVAEPVVRDIAA